MERILNYLDLPPQERDAVCKQLRSLGCSPAHGTRRTMKKEMEKSRPGTLPQYLFLFRDHTLIGYLFLIAEKRGSAEHFLGGPFTMRTSCHETPPFHSWPMESSSPWTAAVQL